MQQDLCGSKVASLLGACDSLERLASIQYFLVEKEVQPNMRSLRKQRLLQKDVNPYIRSLELCKMEK